MYRVYLFSACMTGFSPAYCVAINQTKVFVFDVFVGFESELNIWLHAQAVTTEYDNVLMS